MGDGDLLDWAEAGYLGFEASTVVSGYSIHRFPFPLPESVDHEVRIMNSPLRNSKTLINFGGRQRHRLVNHGSPSGFLGPNYGEGVFQVAFH